MNNSPAYSEILRRARELQKELDKITDHAQPVPQPDPVIDRLDKITDLLTSINSHVWKFVNDKPWDLIPTAQGPNTSDPTWTNDAFRVTKQLAEKMQSDDLIECLEIVGHGITWEGIARIGSEILAEFDRQQKGKP